MSIFGSIAATGAGLHVVQYYLEHHSELDATGTVLAVVIPFCTYSLVLYLMYSVSMRALDPFHVGLIAGTAGCSSRPWRSRPGRVAAGLPRRRGARPARHGRRLRDRRPPPRPRPHRPPPGVIPVESWPTVSPTDPGGGVAGGCVPWAR